MKLIVCDIDGTLLNSPAQKVPSLRLTKAIQNIKDDYVVACATGRARSWARPILAKAQFTAPCILGGGTHIVDPKTQEIIWEQPLLPTTLYGIQAILSAYKDLKVLINDYTEEDYVGGGWPLERLIAAKEVFLMEVVGLNEKLADELIVQFKVLPNVTSIKLVSFRPGVVDIHVLNETSTKEHAIGHVQKMLGISKEDTIGIGDGPNDFHIFNAVGTKIAVDNAVAELKELADIAISDVADDAVAQYFESLLVSRG